MSIVHVQRIKGALKKIFEGLIDVSDCKGDQESREEHFCSRALAAYSLLALAEVDEKTAAASVTDGFDDNGLDAVLYDRTLEVLYVVQSKWSEKGKSPLKQGEILKFLAGFKDLLAPDFSKFNQKVKNHQSDIDVALRSTNVRLVLVIAHNSTEQLSSHAIKSFEDLLNEINDTTNVLSYEVIDQKWLYDYVSGTKSKSTVSLDISLMEWGHVSEPYKAYYGQVAIRDVHSWWVSHGDALFARNLRQFRGSTDVNVSLEDTVTNRPEHFWYFNNGLTILCSSILKQMKGAPSRERTTFSCSGVSIVNGAQTVGVIGSSKTEGELPESATVAVRVISLEGCPDDFDKQVTRANNTQNRIERRDFAALDKQQRRIASELALDDIAYAFKSGDSEDEKTRSFTITDATIALACALPDARHAVQAKREVSRFWENIEKEPYTLLFNDSTDAISVWRSVVVMRAVEGKLEALRQSSTAPRADLVAVHGNRLILHLVFRAPEVVSFRDGKLQESELREKAAQACDVIFPLICDDLQRNHPTAYLAVLFKNASKCQDLVERITGSASTPAKSSGGQMSFLDSPPE